MHASTLKAGLVAVVLILTSGILGGGYFYVRGHQSMAKTRERELEDLKKGERLLKEEITKFKKRQKTVAYQNRDLRNEVKTFENQKSTILDQVKASVAGFETFRRSATDEIARLKASSAVLESEKADVAEKLRSVEDHLEDEKNKLASDLTALNQKIKELETASAQLAENLESKDKISMVAETAKLHYNLGNFYFRNGEYVSAAAEYKKAIFYRPDDADANFNLAIVSDDYINDLDTAIFRYKRYLQLRPNPPDLQKIKRRIFDLELRQRVIDESGASQSKENFMGRDSGFSTLNMASDKR